MASQINASIPADNVKVDKALLRENFRLAETELTELQRVTSTAHYIAFGLKSINTL